MAKMTAKALAQLADNYYTTRQLRLAEQKKVDVIEEKEKALKQSLIDNLPRNDTTGISGKVARATLVTKQLPKVVDWTKFYAYVAKNKAFDLLQRRLGEEAVKARWEDKKVIPGVESFEVLSISLEKM